MVSVPQFEEVAVIGLMKVKVRLSGDELIEYGAVRVHFLSGNV